MQCRKADTLCSTVGPCSILYLVQKDFSAGLLHEQGLVKISSKNGSEDVMPLFLSVCILRSAAAEAVNLTSSVNTPYQP